MTKRIRLVFVQILFALLPICVLGQQHTRFQTSTESLQQAQDLASLDLYALASQNAKASLNQPPSGILLHDDYAHNNAQFLNIINGLKSYQLHALDSALTYWPQLTAKPLQQRLSLAIAQYYFIAGNLVAAIPYYEKVGIENLNNVEIADAKFELAYAYFNNRQFVAANTLFGVMKEVPGKYYNPGNYYFGLLAYNDGDFEGALKSFERINGEPIYKPIVPYYIAEIQYFMGNRDKALSEALRLIKNSEKQYYDKELHLLAAQCLFEDGRYGEALPYFEFYFEHTEKIRKEELYEMGYSYYRVNEWKNAITKFKPLSATQDSLGQTAMYLLGDCYLKNSEKEQARNAFGICSNMPYSSGQREAALMLYSKLSYELGYEDDALRSVQTLMHDFPSGKYGAAADLLLSQIYLETNNFEQAYKALDHGQERTPDYVRVRQRAAFGYAMQEILNQHFLEASTLLDTALANNGAADYTSASIFWKAEMYYRLHDYQQATEKAQQFLSSNSIAAATLISSAATKDHAALTLGYAAMELKDFKKAQQAFSLAKSNNNISPIGTNASLREADALYMQKDFTGAEPLYAAIASGKGSDADYARLQSAIIAGLKGNRSRKINLLQSLLNSIPESKYAVEARYELGMVQLADNNYSESIATLQPLTTAASGANFAPKAFLKIGTALQQLNQDPKALETYSNLVRDFPKSAEKVDALAAIKSIYIARNQPEAYSKLLQDLHQPLASDEELSVTYYNAAELQYAAGKWSEAQTGFDRYLSIYPNGPSANKALYYLGNSLYNQKNFHTARVVYDTLLRGLWNAYSEESVKRAAELAFADTAYGEAIRYYELMAAHAGSAATSTLAYIGLMRSADKMNNAPLALAYADTLLLQENVSSAIRDEAKIQQLRRAILLANNRSTDSLIASLKESSNSAVAAESRYYGAQQLMNAGKLKDAENAAGANIKKSAGIDYWVIKSYLLLGDIFTKEQDYFNARATLQSVAAHAVIPELKEEAKRKLEGLKVMEGSKLSND